MSPIEVEKFQSALNDAKVYLEFGAGYSTLMAARSSTHTFSIENHPYWFRTVSEEPEVAKAIEERRLELIYTSIGDVKGYAFPTDFTNTYLWPTYYQRIWQTIDVLPDLILVDGRFRVACTLTALMYINVDTTIAIHDFWNRPHYHVVLPFLTLVDKVETFGFFKPRIDIDWRDLVKVRDKHLFEP